ncbi:MAG: hypothetical protein HYX52_05905 [Chloroflexi bacterium]|nr:hypothetical protein [Chloroflexota bacterium]
MSESSSKFLGVCRAARLGAAWRTALVVALAATTVVGPTAGRAEVVAQTPDPRTFPQTGYRVDRESFWDFFQKRGGVRTFGYPASKDFSFLGCTTQFFQRVIMQQCGSAGVNTLNLLDAGLLPYTRINGSVFPASDPVLLSRAPAANDPQYDSKVVDFVRANAPDTFEGEPVNFFSTFQNTVTLEDAFPEGNGDPNLLPLLNLELWGLPTSAPQRDPTNRNFIYQRFQRGIMHYDKGTGLTQGLLLADYLKAVITGQNLPADLDVQARNSPLYRSAINGNVPTGTSYVNAFIGVTVAGAQPTATPSTAGTPTATATPQPSTAPSVPSPDYGLSMFIWGNQSTTSRDIKLATDANFRWQKTLFKWRDIEGRCKGCFDWTEADRIVRASNAAGVKILARLDFQPTWARRDGANNGPPDNYQDFNDFVTALVSRYKTGSSIGRVDAIEIWNEVNLNREWGMQPINRSQAADYVRLLGGAYTAAHAVDPTITVVTAGLSPTGWKDQTAWDDAEYMQWLYDAGMKGKYDALGAHGNTQAPCVECALNSDPRFPHESFYFRRVEQLRQVMERNGDAAKQVWLLEFGWTADTIHPAYSWFAVSEEKKAQNVVAAFQYARQNWRPWVGVMFLWTLPDPQWPADREEVWWAITNTDGSPRPAYTAVKNARTNGTLP